MHTSAVQLWKLAGHKKCVTFSVLLQCLVACLLSCFMLFVRLSLVKCGRENIVVLFMSCVLTPSPLITATLLKPEQEAEASDRKWLQGNIPLSSASIDLELWSSAVQVLSPAVFANFCTNTGCVQHLNWQMCDLDSRMSQKTNGAGTMADSRSLTLFLNVFFI